jgi:hypothetical protein
MADFPPTAGLINSLDPNNPIDANKVFGGNNWLQFLQDVLKTNQFPISEDGSSNGWDIALTVKASEVNSLQGIDPSETVEERLFASGTKMAFFQVSAPTGWTQLTDTEVPGLNNSLLRVVQTAGGGNGGSASPIQMTGDQVPQHPHTFTGDAVADHWHELFRSQSGTSSFAPVDTIVPDGAINVTGKQSMAPEGGHTPTGTIAVNGSNATWEPKYVDMIIASKD